MCALFIFKYYLHSVAVKETDSYLHFQCKKKITLHVHRFTLSQFIVSGDVWKLSRTSLQVTERHKDASKRIIISTDIPRTTIIKQILSHYYPFHLFIFFIDFFHLQYSALIFRMFPRSFAYNELYYREVISRQLILIFSCDFLTKFRLLRCCFS